MTSQPLIAAQHVTKSYGDGEGRVVAVEDVTLDIDQGRFSLIRGPSGSGKTTLLHCLSTIALPDSGRVLFDGADLSGLDDDARSDLRARAMGFVFQRFNLLPALTVEENVDLPLLLQGWERDRVVSRTEEVLTTVGMQDRRGAYPDQLSGGQLQLVAVARAITTHPRVLWADEPTGALDTDSAEMVLRILRRVVEDGTALVLVSHDPQVEGHADSVIMLHDGRIVGNEPGGSSHDHAG